MWHFAGGPVATLSTALNDVNHPNPYEQLTNTPGMVTVRIQTFNLQSCGWERLHFTISQCRNKQTIEACMGGSVTQINTFFVKWFYVRLFCTHDIYPTSVRPGRGIPPLLLVLRFLPFFPLKSTNANKPLHTKDGNLSDHINTW